MDVRWCVLESRVLGGDEVFDVVGSFVVHFVETWFEPSAGKIFVSDLVGAEEFLFGSILDGNGGNEVGVVDVEDNKVCIAAIGGDWEAAGLIGEYHAADVMDVHVDEVGGFDVDGRCW